VEPSCLVSLIVGFKPRGEIHFDTSREVTGSIN